MGDNPNRPEAERLLGIAEKLLGSGDLNGAKEFAILAQETEPLLEGTDQILAVVDVLLASAADNTINNHPNWYRILQIEDPDQSSTDNDLIKRQYRRLALLLHPDKNRFPYADQAFRFVVDAWDVLSTASKKSQFDRDFNRIFTKVDLNSQKKKPNSSNERMATFWTACPYCYSLHEYPRVYQEYCIRCQHCQRAFHAASIPELPPLVPGKEEYYCCWGFFPMGFSGGKGGGGEANGNGVDTAKFPNWMPPVFSSIHNENGGVSAPNNVNGGGFTTPVPAPAPVAATPVVASSSHSVPISFNGWKRDNEAMVGSNNLGVNSDGAPKKKGRGRPKKNPVL